MKADRDTSARERVLRDPVRRRILRWLHRDFEPHYVAELCRDLSLDATEFDHHTAVLESHRMVKQFDGDDGPLIESRAGGALDVRAVLLKTQGRDGPA